MMPPVRLVLVRPHTPENVGAAARVLANFGLDDWVLVAPAAVDAGAARRLAVNAGHLLEAVRVAATLEEAVSDCALVLGTSSRRPGRRRLLTPEEAAAAAVAAARSGRTAIVFGGERDGLSAEELARCDAVSCVPTEAAQPSLNLAQAVALYAHAVSRAFRAPAARAQGSPAAGREASPPAAPGRSPRAATDGELRNLEEALRCALRRGGFLAGPERHAVRDLAATLRRARLSQSEIRLWNAALRRLGRPG